MFLDDELKKVIEIEKFYRNEQTKLQKQINKYLTDNDKELEKIYADRQLKEKLTKWLKILNESGLDWEKIEINNHIIKIYNFKGEK